MNVMPILAIARRSGRSEPLICDDIRKTQNGIERGPQLMTHIREKRGFGRVRRLRLKAFPQRLIVSMPEFESEILIGKPALENDVELSLDGHCEHDGAKERYADEIYQSQGVGQRSNCKSRECKQGRRQHRGQIHGHVHGPGGGESPEHANDAHGHENIVGRVVVLPEQPGHCTPGRTDDRLEYC